MDNKKPTVSDTIIKKLNSYGTQAAFIPFSYMSLISEIHTTHIDNSENTPFNIKSNFNANQPPKITFEPLSFLVIANQSPEGEICVNYKDRHISIPIPSGYLDSATRQQRIEEFDAVMKGYQYSPAWGISFKLLAVLSGLGKYGRNTLCYSDEWGSWCSFFAFYTNIPCEDNGSKIVYMDDCETCGRCIKNCPTSAIGGQLAIDASRCLTMHNEFNVPLPEWISPGMHHALFGCMRCQEVCPVNKSKPAVKKEALELNKKETKALLSGKLPSELIRKLLDYGFIEQFISFTGRNIKLVIEAMECSETIYSLK